MVLGGGRAERLLETGLALAAELSLPALLQRIVDLAVDLTDARYGALGVLAADGVDLADFITSGLNRARARPPSASSRTGAASSAC